MRYQTLLIDLDDTLLDFKKAEQIALEKILLQYIGKTDASIKQFYQEINSVLWNQFDRGKITRQDIYDTRFTELFRMLQIEKDGRIANREYLDSIEGIWIEGAEEICRKLSKNHDIYIVSNGDPLVQNRKMKEMRIEKNINGAFISGETAYAKPSKNFFDSIFSKIENIDLGKTLMIGDRLTSDIRGGNNAGIDTCWYNPKSKTITEEVEITYEIRELEELLEIVK